MLHGYSIDRLVCMCAYYIYMYACLSVCIIRYPLNGENTWKHAFVLSCEFLKSKHKNMHVSMYFLYLVLNFTPHYIITDKGLLL